MKQKSSSKVALLYLLPLLLAASSCTQQKQDYASAQISINECGTIDSCSILDYFTKEWESIYLDTCSESLISSVERIEIDDSLIFILNKENFGKRTICVFNIDGKYIGRIGNIGRAHNEYITIRAWTLDKANNEVLIKTGESPTIKRYNYQGNYIGSINLSFKFNSISELSVMQNGNILAKNLIYAEPIDDYLVIDSTGTTSSIFNLRNISASDALFMPFDSYHSCENAELMLLRDFDNHVFRYNCLTGESDTIAQLQFVSTIKAKDLRNIHYNQRFMKKGSQLDILCDLNDYLILDFFFQDDYDCVYCKNEDKWYIQPKNKAIANKSVPQYEQIVGIYGNTIIGYISNNYAEQWIGNNIAMDHHYERMAQCANPTIVLYHL